MSFWPFISRHERIRREAARWLARLNGPGSGADRAEFEQWYGASPEHAQAFDRLGRMFDVARQLPPAAKVEASPARSYRPFIPRPVLAAAVVAGLCVVLLQAWPFVSQLIAPHTTGPVQNTHLVAGVGGKIIRLADGSRVALAQGGELEVRIGKGARELYLMRGEARFKVFHERRPFVVLARGARVVARGTEFTVSLARNGTLVTLIEGRVDISYPSDAGRLAAKLSPGEHLLVPLRMDNRPGDSAPLAPAAAGQMIEFDDVDLAQAIDRMGAEAKRTIRLADPALARLRVTGAFRADDIDGFARGVANALGLRLERARDGTFWMHPARPR